MVDMADLNTQDAPEVPEVPEAPKAPEPAAKAPESKASEPAKAGTEAAKPEVKDPKNPTKEEQAAIKKWKLKFGDKEEEVDEQELVRRAQKAWGIEQKAEKASADRKLAEEFFNLAKSGDFSWLDRLSTPEQKIEAKALVSEWLVKQALAEDEEKRLTPEQKELRETKRKLAEFQSKEEEKLKAQREADRKAAEEKFSKELQEDYKKAAEEHGLVAENEVVQALTSMYLERAVKEGMVVTPREVLPIVKRHIETLDEARFNSYDGEKLINWMGKHIEKVRKADLERIKGVKPKTDTPKAAEKPVKKEEKVEEAKETNSFKEMIRKNRRNWDEA